MSLSDFVLNKLEEQVKDKVEYNLIKEALEARNKLMSNLIVLSNHKNGKKYQSNINMGLLE